jgi:homopolymeric O-antigen transport system permease protein
MEAHESTSIRVIEPVGSVGLPSVGELWDNRDLIYYLARQYVVVRYRQAVVGVLWAVIQPVVIAVVFSVFLGLLAKVPSEKGIPYPLFAISGMVMWLYFARTLDAVAASTADSGALISKIYFPRLAIPIASVAAPSIDFLFGLLVVVVAAVAYGFPPSVQLLLVPIPFLFALLTATGLGFWLSALNVKYRDIRLIVPFALLIGLFITPITYPFSLVPDNLQALYSLNPMVGVLEMFRWCVLGTSWPGALLLIPATTSVVFFLAGALYFHRAERGFADVI